MRTRLLLTLAAFFAAAALLLPQALPAAPQPTIKQFSSVLSLQIYPEVKVIRTDRMQTVERSHKGNRLPIAQSAQGVPASFLSPKLTVPAQVWLKPAKLRYNPPPVPFHCSAIIGCEII